MMPGKDEDAQEIALKKAVARGAVKRGGNKGVELYYFPKISFGETEQNNEKQSISRSS